MDLRQERFFTRVLEANSVFNGVVYGVTVGFAARGPVGAIIVAEVVTAAQLAVIHLFLGRDIEQRSHLKSQEI